MLEELDQDYEALGETAEEWPEEPATELLSDADRAALEAEIADLDSFTQLATSIDSCFCSLSLSRLEIVPSAPAIAFKVENRFETGSVQPELAGLAAAHPSRMPLRSNNCFVAAFLRVSS